MNLELERNILAAEWQKINGGTWEEALAEADRTIAIMREKLEEMMKDVKK